MKAQAEGAADRSAADGDAPAPGGELAERVLRALVDSAPDGIVVVDRSGRIRLVNAQAERLFGYPRAELLGQSLELLLPERCRSAHATYRRGYLAGPQTRSMAVGRRPTGRRWDGSEFPVEVSLSPLPSDGELLVTAVVRDVTERARAEALLEESRRQLAEAEAIAHIGSWTWDIGQNRISWSDELYRIYGLDPASFAATYEAYLERIHPDDRAFVASVVETAYRTGQPFDFEHRIVRPDGAVRVLHGRGQVVRDEAGRPVRMVGTGQDITERKEAEERARELVREQAARAEAEAAQRRMAFLAEASQALAESLDFETTLANLARLAVPTLADWCVVDLVEPDGRIRRVAVVCADPSKEPLARELRERFAPDSSRPEGVPKVLRTGRAELIAEASPAWLEATAVGPEHLAILRRIAPKSYLILPLSARGRVLGALMFVTAESGRRYGPADLLLGEELARRAALAVDNALLYQAAQAAVRARDEFLSVAAHELKTPITSLHGYAQLVLRQLARTGQLDPDRVRRALEVITTQAEKLTRLVSQLFDISRLETGRLQLAPAPTDLAQLVAGVVASFRMSHPQRSLVARGPDRLMARVDPLRIEQVLTNLLDNALKYSPVDTPVEVELGESGDGRVRLTVRDRGQGVAPEHRERIFDRFYQVTVGDYASGLGLGLYISQQIVQLHGGEIHAEFPADGGTRIVVTLPCGAVE